MRIERQTSSPWASKIVVALAGPPEKTVLSTNQTRFEESISAGVTRLLERAANRRSLDVAAVVPRVRATVEKYVLKHSPAAVSSEIDAFIDGLRR